MVEATVLYGAIAFLAATLIALAKITWNERGQRLVEAERQSEYYRDKIPQLLEGLVADRERQDEQMEQLADLIERALKTRITP